MGRASAAGATCINPQIKSRMSKYSDVVSGVCSDGTTLAVEYGASQIKEGQYVPQDKVRQGLNAAVCTAMASKVVTACTTTEQAIEAADDVSYMLP